jgi:D-alanyl-D-alanine carboxypeptidase
MKLNKIYPTFLLFLVIIFFVGCSDDKNLSLEQKLQNVLDHKIEEFSTNGVSAAVIFSENKKWMGSSGISHDTVTVKTDMVFAIGSVTKNFVATLTLKFVEEGKLSLEDPLSKWLPEYRYINKDITIRQLLNHTSGIYMFWSNQKIWDDLKKDKSKIWTPEEVLTYIKEPYFEPGEGFRYSNTNYLLLAMIITKATNSTLSSNFKEYFWQPLNIKSARLSMEEKIPDNQAHVYGDDPYYDMTYKPREAHESITYGSSGIFMTAMDLASWCHTLFEGKILKQQSMDEMFEFVNLRARNNMSTYGLGVQLYSKKLTNGKKAYGHSGANIGTSTYMIYLPKNHLSVVVMINSMDHRCSKSILKDLIKISLKEMNDYSIIPIFHYGPIIISAATFWLIYIIVYVRKKRKRKIRSDNSMIQG